MRVTVEQEFSTPVEIAAKLGVHHNKVLGWIKSGELKASNLATSRDGVQPRYRVHKSDLETFLQARSNRVEPPPTTRKPRLPDRIRQYV